MLASDVANISEAAQISGNYSISLSPAIIAIVLIFLAFIAAALLFMKARWRRKAPRFGLLLFSLLLCALLYKGAYASEKVYDYTSNLSVEFGDGYKMSEWNGTDLYCGRGFMYPLINSFGDLVKRPVDYDRREAGESLSSLGGGDIEPGKKVNVVAVMLEAYCDLSKLEAISIGSSDPYDFFHRLQQESVHGSLVTNVFAGGTVDTERAFLTGSTCLYEYRSAADSFVHWFSAQGYSCDFAHPGFEWFYERRNVTEYLGFDRAFFSEDRYRASGPLDIMDDAGFLADIRGLYEEAASENSPYFSFSVTYQNHGPYNADRLDAPDGDFVERGSMSVEAYNILSNYLYGISKTDAALEDFVNSFRNDEEAVVLIFFGDHKPWLGDGASVYTELGIDLSRESYESFFNYYETPYVIWANDAAKEALGSDFVGEGATISPCFLMQELFELCSWEGEGFMEALRRLRSEGVSVVNSSERFVEDGLLVSELSPEAREALELVEKLQYYRMRDMEVD